MRLNTSLVDINMVGTYRAYSKSTVDTDPQWRLYKYFAEYLIENNYDVIETVLGSCHINSEDERKVIFSQITGSSRS